MSSFPGQALLRLGPHREETKRRSANRMPKIVIPLMNTTTQRERCLDARAQADAWPSFSSFLWNTVIKAVDRAPSAKRSRSKFRDAERNNEMHLSLSPPNSVPLNNTSLHQPQAHARVHITAMAITPLAF